MGTENKIAVLSTTTHLTRRVRKLAKEMGRNYIIREVIIRDIVSVARELVNQGAEVFISRGYTTRLLRENFSIPVVNIDHTFYDCIASYREARDLSPCVAFAAASEEFVGILKKYHSFFDDAAIYHFDLNRSDKDILAKLGAMRDQDGIEVVIGGLMLEPYAKQAGLLYVMSDADEDQILAAFEAAEHFLSIETALHEQAHQLRNHLEVIKSILNCTTEGVIRIDRDSVVTNINVIAQAFLSSDALGRDIGDFLPSPRFAEVLADGIHVSDEIVLCRDDAFVLNMAPTIVEGDITGAVITLQRQMTIEKTERKIRSKLLDKGHVSDKTFVDILGDSESIARAKSLAVKYAGVNSTVLILGRTGTGKELFAQSIHNASKRKNAPFVAINCAAFPPGVLESELFGYVKGAFTGAINEGRPGIFELAHSGTIFLDEISEAPLDVQLKLLRVIQERKVVRIGDDKVIPVDVRIIAASNRDLLEMVEAGLFREDFYYRICVLELRLPTLSERRQDIPIMVRNFLGSGEIPPCQLTESALAMLCDAEWPGNIRQLRNTIERLAVTCEGGLVDVDVIARSAGLLQKGSASRTAARTVHNHDLFTESNERNELAEAQLIRDALTRHGGRRPAAAAELGISVSTLFRRIQKIRRRRPDFFNMVKYANILRH